MRRRHLPRPCLILVMGVAGCGKTTLAQQLVRRLWAVYLDNNHIVDAFFPHTRSGRRYQRLRPRFYQVLYATTEANLRAGNSVLLDAPHVKQVQQENWCDFIAQLVRRNGARLAVIRCFCPEKTLRHRLESRGEKRDRPKFARWRSFLQKEPLRVPVPFPHLDVDTTQNLARNADAATKYVVNCCLQPRKRGSLIS